MLPEAQVVHPLHPCPPHCANFATEQPPPPGAAVVVTGFVVLVERVVGLGVVVVPGLAVVTGLDPPPLLPQEKTAGPGTV